MTVNGADEAIPAALRDRLSSALASVGAGDAAAYLLAAGLTPEPARSASADDVMEDAAGDTAGDAAAMLMAGEALLAGVLRADAGSRGTALDLLAADALVTHAFERAADAPASLPALAAASMRRIALLADVAG